jgi:hypothetical protein
MTPSISYDTATIHRSNFGADRFDRDYQWIAEHDCPISSMLSAVSVFSLTWRAAIADYSLSDGMNSRTFRGIVSRRNQYEIPIASRSG